eukprot:g1081.t1
MATAAATLDAASVATTKGYMTDLEEKLNAEKPDPSTIRRLCIATGCEIPSHLRREVWEILLGVDRRKCRWLNASIAEVKGEDSKNQRIVRVDIERTRADLCEFQLISTRRLMVKLLNFFCRQRGIPYKQGLNEVLAPFVYLAIKGCVSGDGNYGYVKEKSHQNVVDGSNLNSNFEVSDSAKKRFERQNSKFTLQNGQYSDLDMVSNATGGAIFECFYAFVEKFMPHAYTDDGDFVSLQCQLRLFHLLLQFHDPKLCNHLARFEMMPELYATPWFLTLFAHSTPLDVLFRIWDWYILRDNPYLHTFLCLAVLLSERSVLLLQGEDSLPVFMSRLKIHTSLTSGESRPIDEQLRLMQNALLLQSYTPPSFYEHLHTACFLPDPPSLKLLDQTQKCPCLLISAKSLMKSAIQNIELSEISSMNKSGKKSEVKNESLSGILKKEVVQNSKSILSSSEWIPHIGLRCLVRMPGKTSRIGQVKFVGKTDFAKGIWIGLCLEQPVGKNNGSILGVHYFHCNYPHGIFVHPATLTPLVGPNESAPHVQSIICDCRPPSLFDKSHFPFSINLDDSVLDSTTAGKVKLVQIVKKFARLKRKGISFTFIGDLYKIGVIDQLIEIFVNNGVQMVSLVKGGFPACINSLRKLEEEKGEKFQSLLLLSGPSLPPSNVHKKNASTSLTLAHQQFLKINADSTTDHLKNTFNEVFRNFSSLLDTPEEDFGGKSPKIYSKHYKEANKQNRSKEERVNSEGGWETMRRAFSFSWLTSKNGKDEVTNKKTVSRLAPDVSQPIEMWAEQLGGISNLFQCRRILSSRRVVPRWIAVSPTDVLCLRPVYKSNEKFSDSEMLSCEYASLEARFGLEVLDKITSRKSTPQLVVFHVRREAALSVAQLSFLVPEKQACIAQIGSNFNALKAIKLERAKKWQT